MAQSRLRSWYEAWTNIFIGYAVSFVANLIVLPLLGHDITVKDSLVIGVVYTVISLVRQYFIRRWMNKGD